MIAVLEPENPGGLDIPRGSWCLCSAMNKTIEVYGRELRVSTTGEVWREPFVDVLNRKQLRRRLKATPNILGYPRVSIGMNRKRRTVLVHHLVAHAFLDGYAIGTGQYLDHINGDRADNRLENLRIVSHQGNARAYKAPRGGTSRFRGVCWIKTRKKWMASIKANGGHIHLGHFDDEVRAAKVRDLAALHYGFYPEALNFPELATL